MINNNPYILPEKPLKQSTIFIETGPNYVIPSRRIEDMNVKPNHFMKRSSMGSPYQNQYCEPMRYPLSPQPQFKASIGQIQNFIYQDPQKEFPNDKNIKEINAKIQNIFNRLDLHQNKLNSILETSHSDVLKDSIVCTYEGSQKEISMKTIEMMECINKVKEELEILKSNKIDHQIAWKDTIANRLLNQFKNSLQIKFQEEQTKIQKWISDFSQHHEKLFEQKVIAMKIEVNRCIQLIDQTSKKIEQQKASNFSIRLDKLKVSSLKTHREAYTLSYEQYYKVSRSNVQVQEIKISEKVYYIDSEGYLLDNNFYYLLDESSCMIKITEQQKQLLKLHSVLH